MNEHEASTGPLFHVAPGSAKSDLLIAGLAFLFMFTTFVYVDFVEVLFDYSREHEDWELDEVFASVPALALVAAWFSYRRWRQVVVLNGQLRGALEEVREGVRQRHILQTQLRDAQRMEALGTLAGGIAHELNNMLQPIVTLAQLSLKRDELSARTRTGLEKILLAAERGREIVRRTLAFAGGSSGEKDWVPLSEALSEVVGFLRETASSRIEIVTEIEPDQGLARLDRTGLMQVMTNLLNNAADAMTHSGRISVTMKPRQVTDAEAVPLGLPPGDYFGITVRDEGSGMTDDVGGRIFDPFFTTKGADGGSGLGLSVVHGIVSDWDGTITVDTKIGEGTTFEILVPRRLPEAA